MNRFRLGDEVHITVQCRDVDGLPADPDSAPTLWIYGTLFGGSDAVETLRMPPKDVHDVSGLFESVVLLGDLYSDPDYTPTFAWRAAWTVDNIAFVQHGVFHLVGGGAELGAVEAAEYLDKRGHTHVLEQLASGDYSIGHNPRM